MATATQLAPPRAVFTDANGAPLAGGFVHAYVAGGGTTPKATYQDAAETIPNSNPIVLDASGSCLLYGFGTYTLAVTDAAGNAVPAYCGTTEAGIIDNTDVLNYTLPATGAVTRTVTSKLGDVVSIKDFGAVAGVGVNNSAALQACLVAIGTAGGGIMYIPQGQWEFSATLILPANVRIIGAGQGSVLRGTTAAMTMLSYSGGAMTSCGIEISNLTIDGGAAGVVGIRAVLASGFSVRDILFTGLSQTVYMDRCNAPLIADCLSRGNASRAGGQLMLDNTTGGANGLSSMGLIRHYNNDCSAQFGIAGAQTQPLIMIQETNITQVEDCVAEQLQAAGTNLITHIQNQGLCQGNKMLRCVSIGAKIGILIQGGAAFADSPSFISIIDCDIDLFGTAAVSVTSPNALAMNFIRIIGGFFTGGINAANPFISLSACSLGCAVIGAAIYQEFGYPVKSGVGVDIVNSSHTTVTDCDFGQLDKGVRLTGTSSLAKITGNRFSACNTDVVTLATTGNRYSDNIHDAVTTATLPSLPATTVPWANDTGYWISISISGGTVTNIGGNTGLTGLTSGTFLLAPGGFNLIYVVYTVAPTWTAAVMS